MRLIIPGLLRLQAVLCGVLACAPATAQSPWSPGPAMLTAREDFALITLADGRLLAAGGVDRSGVATPYCEVFDPATRRWSPAGRMWTPRIDPAGVRLRDGRVLVVGGAFPLRGEIYDPRTGQWMSTSEGWSPGLDSGARGVLLHDGRVLVQDSSLVEVYDPVTDVWTKLSVPPRTLASVALLRDGRVLIAGGPRNGTTTAVVWDPVGNSWRETGPHVVPRYYSTLTPLDDGRVLLVGGASALGAGIAAAEVFDPATLGWSQAGTLAQPRQWHTATRLRDGTVAVAGGTSPTLPDPRPLLDSIEIYDPATNSFRPGPSLPGFRTRAQTALLPRGELMIAGGRDLVGRIASVQILGPALWHSWFAVDTLETPYVGDFNGDGRTDIVTFTRQNPNAIGDVYVALSDGTKFGDNTKWHDWFAITTDETVVIGDYDGDGKDDIATWLGKTTRQVYVARSLGTGMTPEAVWVDGIGFDATDVILSGDVNGDRKDDLVCFARRQGRVYVALSDGAKFTAPTVWHDWFAVSTYERPRVADVDGDGRSDIVTFATDSPTAKGDVYVAMSDGTRFGENRKWHDWFAIQQTEQVRIGDLDGDKKDDFFTFLPAPMAQAYTVRSLGTSMDANVLWPEPVAPAAKDVPLVGDANGDGKADVIVFAQSEGKVYVSFGR